MSYIFDNVILVDADGVILYWEHAYAMWMLENGYGLPREGYYELHEKYDISEKESRLMSKMFNESAALTRLPPFRDAIKYVRKLHEEHGYVFHCITAIPNLPSVYEARWKNIRSLFGETPFERLILTETSAGKDKYLKEYKDSGCFWVEDLPKNSELGLKYGLQCLLLDNHYNKTYENPEVKRVKNWKEIYGIITGEV